MALLPPTSSLTLSKCAITLHTPLVLREEKSTPDKPTNQAKANYSITATVRTQDKADAIIAAHPNWKDKVTFALVPDFSAPVPFDRVFKDASRPFNYVIHAASPLPEQASNILTEVIEPSVHGFAISSPTQLGLEERGGGKKTDQSFSTREIFESAARFGGETLKRLVLLGSAVSVFNPFEDTSREGGVYTEKDWNPVILRT